jgi:GNAT superfamily N-acetyltransferase
MAERDRRLVIVAAGPDHLGDLDPKYCRGCAYWETTGRYPCREARSTAGYRKREWYRQKGAGGRIAYLDGHCVGYAQYGSPAAFPRVIDYAAGSPSEDALFLGCLFVVPDARGAGIGRALLEAVEAEAGARGCLAVETFARRGSARNPAGPLAFYLNRGYRVALGDAEYPLVRKTIAVAPG